MPASCTDTLPVRFGAMEAQALAVGKRLVELLPRKRINSGSGLRLTRDAGEA